MQDSQIEKGIADIVEEEIKISKQAVFSNAFVIKLLKNRTEPS